MKATVNLEGLHKLADLHRRYVLKSKRIGCFFCCQISKPSEIKEWIDVRRTTIWPKKRKARYTTKELLAMPVKQEGQTALCPKCGIDSVIPSGTFGFTVTKPLLKAMCLRWFGRKR